MTLRGGLTKLSECRHMEEGSSSNRHTVAKKAYFTVSLALFTVYLGGGEGGNRWVENVIWGRGWLKTSEYHNGGEEEGA